MSGRARFKVVIAEGDHFFPTVDVVSTQDFHHWDGLTANRAERRFKGFTEAHAVARAQRWLRKTGRD